ncbi:MAG: magnesium transporter [Alphaproteobacteria bacterium]
MPQTDTARDHLAEPVPKARASDTVGAVLQALRGMRFASAEAVYLTDAEGRYEGLVPMAALLAAGTNLALGTLARRDAPAVTPDTDQEHVAALANDYRLSAVPVVDDRGGLLGVVPPEALIEVLHREHVEDLHRLAGIVLGARDARRAIEDPPLRRVRRRVPWLLVGLAGSVVATALVARFEAVLKDSVALAFFIPAIVYLADAIGTQTETVAVRGLSVVHRPLGRLLAGEALTGFLIGLVLALFSLPLVWLGFGDWALALTVALAILAAGTVAAAIGMVLPWLLSRFGADPAFGSGPVATIIQDVLSLLLYFLTATWLLGT